MQVFMAVACFGKRSQKTHPKHSEHGWGSGARVAEKRASDSDDPGGTPLSRCCFYLLSSVWWGATRTSYQLLRFYFVLVRLFSTLYNSVHIFMFEALHVGASIRSCSLIKYPFEIPI